MVCCGILCEVSFQVVQLVTNSDSSLFEVTWFPGSSPTQFINKIINNTKITFELRTPPQKKKTPQNGNSFDFLSGFFFTEISPKTSSTYVPLFTKQTTCMRCRNGRPFFSPAAKHCDGFERTPSCRSTLSRVDFIRGCAGRYTGKR